MRAKQNHKNNRPAAGKDERQEKDITEEYLYDEEDSLQYETVTEDDFDLPESDSNIDFPDQEDTSLPDDVLQPSHAKEQLPEDHKNDTSEPVISLVNVSKQYTREAPAVSHVSLNVEEGEFLFITGETGSGKSTLLKLIMHELRPSSGEIQVLGYDLVHIPHRKVARFRRNLGIVFQDFRLLKDRNVYENVAFAQRIIQVPSAQIRRNVTDVLSMVGMADKYKRKVTQLSGGEQQRVALARAIVNKPFILLADEPTGNLDADTAWDIMQLIDRINKINQTTVVVVTHDRNIVSRMHRRVVEMKQGEIVSDGYPDLSVTGYGHTYQDVDEY